MKYVWVIKFTLRWNMVRMINISLTCIWYFGIDDNIDETYGINVQFEESDNEDEGDTFGEVREDAEQEKEDEGVEATDVHKLTAKVRCFYLRPSNQ